MTQKIVLVDGFKIRNTLDDDFGIVETRSDRIAHEFPRFWIPEGEVWVDHRYADEKEFLAEMNDFTFPTKEHTYEERRELAKTKFCTLDKQTDVTVRSELLGHLTLRFVDGAMVRRCHDPEFILGGHDLVYDYIPAKEIWLDNKMDPKEVPYILEHEAVERRLMAEGKPYHIAHEYATITDKEMRRREGAAYPSDPNFEYDKLTNEEMLKLYVVQG